MAGDWIKVEKCAPGKPEVMRLARLWGVPQDQALGALIRFWIWIDDACVDGVVDGVASHEIDDMMRIQGFAQGLVSVGWLQVDDAKPRTIIPNFGKHNSETAKKRALSNDRQARWREKTVDASVDAKTSTREEKRREEITTKSKTKPARKRAPLDANPPEGVLQETWWAWLRHKGSNQTADADRLQRKHLASWQREGHDPNEIVERAVAGHWAGLHPPDKPPPKQSLRERGVANMDRITGQANGHRTINGTAERVDFPALPALPNDLRQPLGDDVDRDRSR